MGKLTRVVAVKILIAGNRSESGLFYCREISAQAVHVSLTTHNFPPTPYLRSLALASPLLKVFIFTLDFNKEVTPGKIAC